MSKYTIDITFLELDGNETTDVIKGLSYEKVLEAYAFSKIMNMSVNKMNVHNTEIDNPVISVEEFLVRKIAERCCHGSSTL